MGSSEAVCMQVGEVVTVRKHSSMGCAVVSMTDVRVRQAELQSNHGSDSTDRSKALRWASFALQAYHLVQAIVEDGNECVINGIKVQIKPHTNKDQHDIRNLPCSLASCAHAASLPHLFRLTNAWRPCRVASASYERGRPLSTQLSIPPQLSSFV